MTNKLRQLCRTLARSRNLLLAPSTAVGSRNVIAISALFSQQRLAFSTSPLGQSSFASTPDGINFQVSKGDASLRYVNGHLKLVLMLPGRHEKCELSLRLLNDTAGEVIGYLKAEDRSIDRAQFYTAEGVAIAQNTPIGVVVTAPFSLRLNDTSYSLEPPSNLVQPGDTNLEAKTKSELEEIRNLVSKLYLHLNVETFEQEREQQLVHQLEALQAELAPLEQKRLDLELKAKHHTNRMIWLGLGMMSIQLGILARLTWFDYSWDIVEPISYFVSYSAAIGVYSYFVLTRKDYDYASASDRIFLRHFHKNAIKQELDIGKYNKLKNDLFACESSLKRLRAAPLKTNTRPTAEMHPELKTDPSTIKE